MFDTPSVGCYARAQTPVRHISQNGCHPSRQKSKCRVFSGAFLAAASFGVFACVAHAEVSQPTYPKSDLLLVTTVINATNPYMASWIQGSKDLAAKLGVPLEVVQSNGSSQTEWPASRRRLKGQEDRARHESGGGFKCARCGQDDHCQRRLHGGLVEHAPWHRAEDIRRPFCRFRDLQWHYCRRMNGAERLVQALRYGKHHCFARRARQHGEPGALPGPAQHLQEEPGREAARHAARQLGPGDRASHDPAAYRQVWGQNQRCLDGRRRDDARSISGVQSGRQA